MNGLQRNFMEGSGVVRGMSDLILVMIWITMLTVNLEIWSLRNKLQVD